MQSDWDSLFFRHTPHADQLPDHDARLLRDVGLVRTETGALAFADDPTRLVEAPRNRNRRGWLQAFAALLSPYETVRRQPQGCDQI